MGLFDIFVKFNNIVFLFLNTVEHCFSLNYNLKYIKGCYPNYTLGEVLTTFLFPKMPFNIAHGKIVELISQVYLEVRS